jgi:hypothetical protein
LFNLESNFTDSFLAISIPKDKEGKQQFNICKAMIKSKKWVFEIADNLAEALALLEQYIAAEHHSSTQLEHPPSLM